MKITLDMLPQPNVPNKNGIIFDADALKTAMDKYNATVVQDNRAIVYSSIPKARNDYQCPLTDAVGVIESITFDSTKNSYVASMRLMDTPLGYDLKKSLSGASPEHLNEMFVLGTNKIAELSPNSNLLCNDPALRIDSCTLMSKSEYNLDNVINIDVGPTHHDEDIQETPTESE